ncbi:MAG: hypothetical protein COA32_15595 [Fluviicola sp.]|nr:MAG: hypothetical protein COA32_15595 [Fluviicola sp.]
MKLHKIIVVLFILNSQLIFGQWNIQTGYDFGLIKFPKVENLDRKINFNTLHRTNFVVESILNNGLLFSLNIGYDHYNSKANFSRTTVSNNTRVTNFSYDTNVKNLRLEIGTGYSWSLDHRSTLVVKVYSGVFFISDYKINESQVTNETFSGDNVSNENLLAYQSDFVDLVDFKELYGSDRIGFHPISFSVEYRYEINQYSLNGFLGYAPMRRGFTINNGPESSFNHIFMIGVRMGYFLEKDK